MNAVVSIECAGGRFSPFIRIADILALLLWGLVFSSIGLGYFLYGKKQKAVVPLVCGIVLMIFPYFVSNLWWLIGIGVVLIAIPYFYRL